jgi:hypothetical protein
VPDPISLNGIDDLNRRGELSTLDPVALQRELKARDPGGFLSKLSVSHPHLFSAAPLVIDPKDTRVMRLTVAAVERVVANPMYQAAVLQAAPESAGFDPGNPGVFLGYDFHLTEHGPRLIEINTNAGGAMICLLLGLAQRARAPELAGMSLGPNQPARIEALFAEMFAQEWRSAKRTTPLQSVAIVDEAPAAQYLYPEFLLFQQMFQRHGIQCVITDPRTLSYRDGGLYHRAQRIDLAYNRLTDFNLDAEHLRVLRKAYLDRAVVLTPHPRAHALYANKGNLQLLGDAARLKALGATDDMVELLTRVVPRTVALEKLDAEQAWAERKAWFFKPGSGYGGKAAYRGEKLTRRVWDEIRATGGYVAQEYVPPSERWVRVNGADAQLKVDVRCFAYRGAVQFIAARLYQGQTTNFRTPGGGFAPVYSLSYAI